MCTRVLSVFVGAFVHCWPLHGLIRQFRDVFVVFLFWSPAGNDALLCPDLSVPLRTRLHDPRLMCACWSTKPDETKCKNLKKIK